MKTWQKLGQGLGMMEQYQKGAKFVGWVIDGYVYRSNDSLIKICMDIQIVRICMRILKRRLYVV